MKNPRLFWIVIGLVAVVLAQQFYRVDAQVDTRRDQISPRGTEEAVSIGTGFHGASGTSQATEIYPASNFWQKIGNNIFNTNFGNVGIGTNSPLQKLEVNGGIRLNTGSERPACDESSRGTLWFQKNALGEDTLSLCEKNVATASGSQPAATLPGGREGLSCVSSQSMNSIYCFGGKDAGPYDKIVKYNIFADTASTLATTLPVSVSALSCARNSLTNIIYCFGGKDSLGNYSDQITKFDPSNNVLTVVPTVLPTARAGLSCVEDSSTHLIYCFGGAANGSAGLDAIMKFNTTDNTIATSSPVLPFGLSYSSCVESKINHHMFCFGGANAFGFSKKIIEFDPSSGVVETKSAVFATERRSLSCAERAVGHGIICAGGHDNNGDLLNEITLYDPVNDLMLASSEQLPTSREGLSCLGIENGNDVYCIGGYGLKVSGGLAWLADIFLVLDDVPYLTWHTIN